MAGSTNRGWPIYCTGGVWKYADTDKPVADNPNRLCGHCRGANRADGHDACIGELAGVANACCGHGITGEAYVQFAGTGFRLSGAAALQFIAVASPIRPAGRAVSNASEYGRKRIMKYIGDISKEDALVLYSATGMAANILEFGPGASTHVMAAAIPKGGPPMISYESDANWMTVAVATVAALGLADRCDIRAYDTNAMQNIVPDGPYDLIFVDGETHMRCGFARIAWPGLKVSGIMMFHDTRRKADQAVVADFIASHFSEIDSVTMNADNSNITIIHKGQPKPRLNWNKREGRPRWMSDPRIQRPENWENLLERKQ